VICLDVLQHLPVDGGEASALEEMGRVAKPGGHVLLRTNAQAFPRREDDPENDFHRYEPAELRGRLEAAGLDTLRLSRINAVLGLAEIPRELRSLREEGERGYQGILADAEPGPSPLDRLKRAWLRVEGRLVAAGARLPAGRSIVALARRPA
jgi:SAM-dependent methyltransferase